MELIRTYITPYIKKYKWLMITTIILALLTVLTASMLTFTSGYLITRASEQPATILLLYVPIVGVRAFGISRAVTRYLERLTGHNTVLKILSDMRVHLYDMLEPQALFIRSRFKTGDLLGTLADDIEHLQDAYIRTIFPTVMGLILFLYAVIVLSIFDWLFAVWIALCLSVIVIVYPLLSLYFLKKRQTELKKSHNYMYQLLTDSLFGITDWLISGRKHEFLNKFSSKAQKTHQLEKKIEKWNQARTFQLQVLSGLILVMVGLWAGHAASEGEIIPAYIAAFTLVTFPIIEGLLPLSQAIEKVPNYMESLNRIEHIKKTTPTELTVNPPEVTETPTITLEKVSFQYEGADQLALHNISLSIPYGKKIAVLGKSGAGKSTLMHLLLGTLSPTEGKVFIDGQPPQAFGDHIFNRIGVLNQKPHLFATTVKNNIGLGNQMASDEEIKAVINQVKLGDYIASLANGMDTQMLETGQRFSGGERQRIALARILLKNPPIIVLDEPMVGLDPAIEQDLLDTMLSSLHDKTLIMITHHLMGMEKMDQIIFMDEGDMVMSGTHQELMETNKRYRNLYLLDRGELD